MGNIKKREIPIDHRGPETDTDLNVDLTNTADLGLEIQIAEGVMAIAVSRNRPLLDHERPAAGALSSLAAQIGGKHPLAKPGFHR